MGFLSIRPIARRWRPLLASFGLVATGMGYSLLWGPVIRHHSYWIMPGDIWGTFRSAQFITWGDIGGIYTAGTSLVTFPGILVALAPPALVAHLFHLVESYPYPLSRPSAWIVVGPYEMLLSCLPLFPLDAMAERFRIPPFRRSLLALAELIVLWQVSVVWGHPEDALACGFALYALLMVKDGRPVAAGWLMGVALCIQPLVILVLPVVAFRVPWRSWPGLVLRCLLPSALLLAGPLFSSFHASLHALIDQPNYPTVDHPTPLVHLAPKVGHSVAVAAGPFRVAMVLLATIVGFATRRYKSLEAILFLAGVCFFLRCLLEPVMDPYYIWPVLAVGLLLAAKSGWTPFLLAAAASFAATGFSQHHFSDWTWWSVVNGLLFVVTVAGLLGILRGRSSLQGRLLRHEGTHASPESAPANSTELVGGEL